MGQDIAVDTSFMEDLKDGVKVIDRHVKDTSKAAELAGKLSSRTSSLAARAKNSVLQFPVYISESMDGATAHVLAKALERLYTSLVQTVLAQNSVIDVKDANGLRFLQQFHTNLTNAPSGVGMLSGLVNEFYEPIDDLDAIFSESVFHEEDLGNGVTVTFSHVVPDSSVSRVAFESARLANEPLAGFSYLREDHDPHLNKKKRVDVDHTDTMPAGSLDIARGAAKGRKTPAGKAIDPNGTMSDEDFLKKYLGDGNEVDLGHDQKLIWDAANGKFLRLRNVNTATEIMPPSRALDTPEIIKDTDIRKINGMLPYMIKATFRVVSKNDKTGAVEQSWDQSFLIGVKTVMHKVPLRDIANDLRDIISGSRKSLQKVRHKTGEISTLDRFLNLKGLKRDASYTLSNKRWLGNLKRLGEFEKLNGSLLKAPMKTLTGGNTPIPNASLVLMSTEVDSLKVSTGIDLNDIQHAKSLASSLFLFAMVIVDTTAKTYKIFMPDGNIDWDVQSLGSLDSEIGKIDNSPLVNEIGRKLVMR